MRVCVCVGGGGVQGCVTGTVSEEENYMDCVLTVVTLTILKQPSVIPYVYFLLSGAISD